MSYNIRYKKAKTFQRTKANENNYDDTGFKKYHFPKFKHINKDVKKKKREGKTKTNLKELKER